MQTPFLENLHHESAQAVPYTPPAIICVSVQAPPYSSFNRPATLCFLLTTRPQRAYFAPPTTHLCSALLCSALLCS
ncbi:hypothetical protein, partial [Acetobacter orleanensis]